MPETAVLVDIKGADDNTEEELFNVCVPPRSGAVVVAVGTEGQMVAVLKTGADAVDPNTAEPVSVSVAWSLTKPWSGPALDME